ncbi:ribbon-helix-helix domain-containing protein [Nitrospira sp. Kam-Ns4a]
MPRPSTKVAVSLPSELFRAVERARKKSGKSRSAVLQATIRHWLKQQEQAVLIRDYEAGYRGNRKAVKRSRRLRLRRFDCCRPRSGDTPW